MILDYRSARQEVGMNINTHSLSLSRRESAKCRVHQSWSNSAITHFIGEVVFFRSCGGRRARHFRSIFVRFSAKLDGQQQKINDTWLDGWMKQRFERRFRLEEAIEVEEVHVIRLTQMHSVRRAGLIWLGRGVHTSSRSCMTDVIKNFACLLDVDGMMR